MIENITEDRPAFLAKFARHFYGVDKVNKAVSQEILDWNQMLCLMSSATATTDCVRSFSETDFRNDLTKIDVPVLIIHGDADQTVPIAISGNKTAKSMPKAKYIVYKDAPHGLFITEKNQLNKDLIDFIK
jgi:pimeloyl-ACP methyl ester carboxylesterase